MDAMALHSTTQLNAHQSNSPSPPHSNTSNSSSSRSPTSRPDFSTRSSISSSISLTRRDPILRHRAGTLATLAEREVLRRQMRHTSLRWVDGGAVYIDRGTGEYWEITGPLLTYLRVRRHTQISSASKERLAAFESQLNTMSPAQVGNVVQSVKMETEMVIMEGRRRGDPDWRPDGFVDRAPAAMAEAQRRGILCGPLEDKEILAGLDSWFESLTPAMSPAGTGGRLNAFSPRPTNLT